jgi:muramoyltetrapeptide carboxypeptidase
LASVDRSTQWSTDVTVEGKRVAVVAPAGIPDMDNLAQAVSLVESWGFSVSVGAHVANRLRYLAGSHQHRTSDLLAALSDPAIDIVWIARAGYGCAHVLPALPTTVPCEKTVIGFSDATALFYALRQIPGIGVIHGPTLNGLATKVDDVSRRGVLDTLTGVTPAPLPLERLHGPADSTKGPLVGGNLTGRRIRRRTRTGIARIRRHYAGKHRATFLPPSRTAQDLYLRLSQSRAV